MAAAVLPAAGSALPPEEVMEEEQRGRDPTVGRHHQRISQHSRSRSRERRPVHQSDRHSGPAARGRHRSSSRSRSRNGRRSSRSRSRSGGRGPERLAAAASSQPQPPAAPATEGAVVRANSNASAAVQLLQPANGTEPSSTTQHPPPDEGAAQPPSANGGGSSGTASDALPSERLLASSASLPSSNQTPRAARASDDERRSPARRHRHHRHDGEDDSRGSSREGSKKRRRSRSRSRSRSRRRSSPRERSRSRDGGRRRRSRSASREGGRHAKSSNHHRSRQEERSRRSSRSRSRTRSRTPPREHHHHHRPRAAANGAARQEGASRHDASRPHEQEGRRENGARPRAPAPAGADSGDGGDATRRSPTPGQSSEYGQALPSPPSAGALQRQASSPKQQHARGGDGPGGQRARDPGLSPARQRHEAGNGAAAAGGQGGAAARVNGSGATPAVAAAKAGGGAAARPKLSFQDEELEGEDNTLDPDLLHTSKAALSQRGRPQVGAPGPHHKGPAVTPLGPPTLITRMQLAPPGGGGGGGPASSITGNLGAGTAAAVARASLSLPSLIKQQLGLAVASPGAVEPLLPGGGGVPRVGGHSAAGGVLYGLHRAGGIVIADADDGLAASSSGLSSSEEEGGAEHAGGRGPAAAAFDGAAAGAAGGKLGRVVFGVAQARCARPYMEDRHCCIPCWRPAGGSGRLLDDGVERSYCGVFDGHNGARTAEWAAQRLHALLAQEPAFRTCTGDLGPPSSMASEDAAVSAAIKRAFRTLDDAVLQESEMDKGRDGSTALMVLRLSDSLFVAHAGDSRAVLCRASGLALPLTRDHKPNLPGERARVEAAGGRVELQRCWRVVVDATEDRPGTGLAVSRSLGDIDFKRPLRLVESMPDVARYVPRPGDAFVVLASDGLWDVLSDQDAVDVVSQSLGAHRGCPTVAAATAAAEAALGLAVRRGTMDNVTVVVMALPWGAPS